MHVSAWTSRKKQHHATNDRPLIGDTKGTSQVTSVFSFLRQERAFKSAQALPNIRQQNASRREYSIRIVIALLISPL